VKARAVLSPGLDPARARELQPSQARHHARWQRGLLAAILGMAAVSAVFYYRQNFAGHVGGPMSVEKILWLNYAITAWFVVPAFLLRQPALDGSLRLVLGGFLASMVGRGLAELWLIYVTFGWSPIYGIAHDLFSIGLIAALRRARRGRAGCDPVGAAGGDALDAAGRDAFNAAARRFTTSLQLTLVAEIVFAALFYRMGVHEDAVYFAPPTEAFAHINRLTRWVDVAVYTDLAVFLWRMRRALAPAARPRPLPETST
jgi:hypothetical protein